MPPAARRALGLAAALCAPASLFLLARCGGDHTLPRPCLAQEQPARAGPGNPRLGESDKEEAYGSEDERAGVRGVEESKGDGGEGEGEDRLSD